MYLTRKYLSRRTLLKGAGVAVGLPLLDAMIPAGTALAQTAAAAKLRAGFFYMPHGAVMWNTKHGKAMDRWTPSGAGADFKLSQILEPLEKHKQYVTSFGNLENRASLGSVHKFNPATWLSGVKPDLKAPGPSMSPTIDQIIAGHIGQETALPSMEVASESETQAVACEAGFGCLYSSTISYRNANSPLPMESNPRKVFAALFGEGATAEERVAIVRQKRSILDFITERTKALQQDLGPGDKVLLDRYLDTVREIERRVQLAQNRDLSGVKAPDLPQAEQDIAIDKEVRLLFDLIAVAYQADLTRVASYIMIGEGTNRTYNHIGVPDSFHPLSHHADYVDRLEKLVKIQRYHLERFAEFVDKLAATPEGEGTLLDHSMLLYGSNMGNSNVHSNYPLPTILVGGGAGALKKGGQQIDLAEHTTVSNLHLTLLNKAGVEAKSIGDSTGVIAGV
ncbi:MAG TPA: DUF1552 domain-containing protein [Micropepsaceae bacterium]|nr:DUF1552 domain-containing protein [Micropepsaceae bacterium]